MHVRETANVNSITSLRPLTQPAVCAPRDDFDDDSPYPFRDADDAECIDSLFSDFRADASLHLTRPVVPDYQRDLTMPGVSLYARPIDCPVRDFDFEFYIGNLPM